MADPAVKPPAPEPTPSPIVRVLNRDVGRHHRWSTPSILGQQEPFSSIDDRPVMHPDAARRYAKATGHEVPLAEAVGKVAAEEVEVHPPGIPVILEGFRVSADAVEYLRARDSGGALVARDTTLATLRVL